MIRFAYRESFETTHADPLLGSAEKEYLYPHRRRAVLEKRARDISREYNLTPLVGKTQDGHSSYTKIKVGRFDVTFHHVSDMVQYPRTALFRKQHGAINTLVDQLELGLPEFSDRGEQLYAQILHTTDPLKKSVPKDVTILLPPSSAKESSFRFEIQDLIEAQTMLGKESTFDVNRSKLDIRRKTKEQEERSEQA
jgi:hypothetical protein